MSERGFTLVELLCAAVVCGLVVAAALAAVAPARAIASAAPSAAEGNQRLRVAIDLLAHDLREAGGSPEVAVADLPDLGALTGVIIPQDSLEDDGGDASAAFSAVTIVRVPRLAAQGRLRAPMQHAADALRLQLPPACPGTPAPCGFAEGSEVVVFDRDGRVEFGRVSGADPVEGSLYLDAPTGAWFDTGAAVSAIETVTYGLRTEDEGERRLVRITSAGAEQPLIDHVVSAAFAVEGSRTDVTLVVTAAAASLRGVASVLNRPGASHALAWVPNVEVRFAVWRR